jgi:hypothetical protein
MCPDDPRADPYATRLVKESASGRFLVTLETRPPATGETEWTVEVVDRSGGSFESARMRAWMPDREIGTTPLFHDVVPVSDDRYRVGPFRLTEAGLWEFTVELVTADAIDRAEFVLCVATGPAFDAGRADSGAIADAASTDGALDAAIVRTDAGPCDVIAPTECRDPGLVYSDVAPIFATRCAAECHNGSDDTWPLSTYTHVSDWRSDIRERMLNCTMPPPDSGFSMSLAERATILDWIRCGLPK